MADQIADKKTVWIPGPTGDVTPEATAALADARQAAEQAAASAGQAVAASGAVEAGLTAIASTGPAIMAHFLTADEAAYIALSLDGREFFETGVRIYPPDGVSSIRDPSICYYSGSWWLTYTRSLSPQGGGGGTIQPIGLAKSTDLKTWAFLTPLAAPAGATSTWGPDWFVDSDGPHIIVSARASDTSAFVTYELHPTDARGNMATWSTPTPLGGFPKGVIDAHILKANGKYVAFVSNNTGAYIQRCESTSLMSGWVTTGGGDQFGFGGGHEAPTVAPLADGRWRLYCDNFNETDCIYYSDFSADWSTWTLLAPVNIRARHCTVCPVPIGVPSPRISPKVRAESFAASASVVSGTVTPVGVLSMIPAKTSDAKLAWPGSTGVIAVAEDGFYDLSFTFQITTLGIDASRSFLQIEANGVGVGRQPTQPEDLASMTVTGVFIAAGTQIKFSVYHAQTGSTRTYETTVRICKR